MTTAASRVPTPFPTSLRSAPVVTPPAPRAAPVTARRDAPVLPLTPREVARDLAARQELWLPLVRYQDPRHYVRLAASPRWEAWLLTWLPGQSTGLHDHGGSAGAFAVLAGAVDEAVPLRGTAAEGCRMHLLSRRYRAGQVRAFGARHLHDVGVLGTRRAITLHVYAPQLTTMTRYELVDGRLTVAARERAGQDW